MATYYALFAEQLKQPVVSVPYVDAFGTGKINALQVYRNHVRLAGKVITTPI